MEEPEWAYAVYPLRNYVHGLVTTSSRLINSPLPCVDPSVHPLRSVQFSSVVTETARGV